MILTPSSPPITGEDPSCDDVMVTTFAESFISNTASTLPTRSTTAAVPGNPLTSASAITCPIIWATSASVKCSSLSLQRPSQPPSLAVSSELCCSVGDPAVGASVDKPPPVDPPPQAASIKLSLVITAIWASRIIALNPPAPHFARSAKLCLESLTDAMSD